MKIKIVTNNEKMYQQMDADNCEICMINGTSRDVLAASRDMIQSGWHLASDPLAGYRFRGNPYHTVFLQGIYLDEEASAFDVLRIEKCMLCHERNSFVEPLGAQLREDFCELDFSIAMSTFQGAIQNTRKGCRV